MLHNRKLPQMSPWLTIWYIYIEYCNFQFAVIHCLSIIDLKYYIEDIAECVDINISNN